MGDSGGLMPHTLIFYANFHLFRPSTWISRKRTMEVNPATTISQLISKYGGVVPGSKERNGTVYTFANGANIGSYLPGFETSVYKCLHVKKTA